MKQFLGFVKKEFYHIFRDIRTMLVLFGIPVAQLLIFGYVVNNEIKDIKIAIYDQSKDNVTREITNKIISSGYFILEENLSSANDIENIFRKGDVREVIIFEPGFAKKLEKENKANIQLIADASDANTANLIVNYTNAIILDYLKKEYPFAEFPMQIVPEVRMIYNEEMKSVYMFVPGTMALILMLISAMMTSISIAREKELGTMEVLLVSPLKPVHIVVGKVIPYVVLSFINAVVIILLGYFIFGMPVKGSLVLLLAESLLFISLALSIGIFISTMANSQQVAMFISLFALMLPVLLLSGFIFPIENMPVILQGLSYILPPRYFITIIKNIMLKGVGLTYVWKETFILLGMTFIYITLSVKKFKVRLE
ncbi:MAG: ABC transporter permease [Bacteroidales bacterium]|nr:ABC transporter permease [Bacteroidales bacterium]